MAPPTVSPAPQTLGDDELMDLSTRQLRAFLALREHRNFTRAAAAVHLSQPAFSTMMRGLEEAVGHQLVFRNSKAVHLTPAGERFSDLAERMLKQFDDGIQLLMHGLDPRNQISLAAMVALTYDWLPPILAELRRTSPEVQVELLAVFPKDCITLAAARRVDLAITALDAAPAGVTTEFLWRDPFGVVCRADHPLADLDEVTLDHLFEYPFVHYSHSTLARRQIDRAVQPRQLQMVCETEHIHTIRALVESGVGISLATEMNRRIFASETLVFKPIAGSPIARDIGLAWHQSRPLSEAAQKLATILRESPPAR
jgi:LysR family carnitine catabolism transcriptional activator